MGLSINSLDELEKATSFLRALELMFAVSEEISDLPECASARKVAGTIEIVKYRNPEKKFAVLVLRCDNQIMFKLPLPIDKINKILSEMCAKHEDDLKKLNDLLKGKSRNIVIPIASIPIADLPAELADSAEVQRATSTEDEGTA